MHEVCPAEPPTYLPLAQNLRRRRQGQSDDVWHFGARRTAARTVEDDRRSQTQDEAEYEDNTPASARDDEPVQGGPPSAEP